MLIASFCSKQVGCWVVESVGKYSKCVSSGVTMVSMSNKFHPLIGDGRIEHKQ